MSARLPNGERAILDIPKIEDYCLSLDYPEGRHEARVFRDALGIGRSDARVIADESLAAAGGTAPVPAGADRWGPRWSIEATIARQNKRAVVRTIWMYRNGENIPRCVTCWAP